MAKHNVAAVKHEIQELAIGNYKSYPGEFCPADQSTPGHIQSLAKGYWDSRDGKEVLRDEKLGIHLEDYQDWTKEAYDAFLKLESLN